MRDIFFNVKTVLYSNQTFNKLC